MSGKNLHRWLLYRATGEHPRLIWTDRGQPLLCSEPFPEPVPSNPVPSSIDPAVTRDPDTGEVVFSTSDPELKLPEGVRKLYKCTHHNQFYSR